MANKIDYNRGVMFQSDAATGINVYMYLDNPGVFLSNQGTEVAPELARSAGFDVEKLTKERQLRERMSEAMKAIRAELALGEENKTVVVEREGFKLVDIGVGRFQVLGPDGDVLTKDPLPKEQAELLMDQLVPNPEPVKAKE